MSTMQVSSSYSLRHGVTTYEIKYNPKVTGFKFTQSESLTQTLGSPYPFIRRNGRTNYRKFNIEGLIANPDVADYATYAAMANAEKAYRDAFMSFLCDGRAKLFSSFAEGDMIVHVINIQFNPHVELGRMLYSFSAEVVEVAEYTAENLKTYCEIEEVD